MGKKTVQEDRKWSKTEDALQIKFFENTLHLPPALHLAESAYSSMPQRHIEEDWTHPSVSDSTALNHITCSLLT